MTAASSHAAIGRGVTIQKPRGRRRHLDGLPIRQIVSRVTSGSIRVPAFQRGFVWDADRVAFLMDSIYKGYPFGAIILWRTKTKLTSERALGPFTLPDRDPDYPIDYVLDGQQRLTSTFGVFQSELQPTEGTDTSWTNIFYDFLASVDLQESRFVALPSGQAGSSRYFPISTFFDVTAYRRATSSLDESQAEEIDRVQATFKEAILPVQLIETDDRSSVAIVFERVNRLGIKLDIFQLVSAWTWSDEFDLQGRFSDLSEELERFGFGQIGDDSNLLLRCCAAIVAGDATAAGMLSLSGSDVRDRFDEIRNGVLGAIDFLRQNLNIQRLANLPYPTQLIPLAAFFATPPGEEVQLSFQQRAVINHWFWRSSFGRRFSSGVQKSLNRDIAEAIRLRKEGDSALADVPFSLEADYFVENRFTLGVVNTTTFVLLLAQQQPRSFISGNHLHLSEVLQRYNRAEFHHCFPQRYLKARGYTPDEINRLVNLAFLSSADNKQLGSSAPSMYRNKISQIHQNDVLASALCPSSLFDDDYEAFCDARAALLVEAARELAGMPSQPASGRTGHRFNSEPEADGDLTAPLSEVARYRFYTKGNAESFEAWMTESCPDVNLVRQDPLMADLVNYDEVNRYDRLRIQDAAQSDFAGERVNRWEHFESGED